MKSAMLVSLTRYIMLCIIFSGSSFASQALGSSRINDGVKQQKPSYVFADVYPSPDKQLSKLLAIYRKKGSLSTLTEAPERYAANMITWQMEHGGFGLHDVSFYENPWDGVKKRSEWVSKNRELGNFDDYATVAEVRFFGGSLCS